MFTDYLFHRHVSKIYVLLPYKCYVLNIKSSNNFETRNRFQEFGLVFTLRIRTLLRHVKNVFTTFAVMIRHWRSLFFWPAPKLIKHRTKISQSKILKNCKEMQNIKINNGKTGRLFRFSRFIYDSRPTTLIIKSFAVNVKFFYLGFTRLLPERHLVKPCSNWKNMKFPELAHWALDDKGCAGLISAWLRKWGRALTYAWISNNHIESCH